MDAKYLVTCFDEETELFSFETYRNLEKAIAALRDEWWEQMSAYINVEPLDLVLDASDDYKFVSHIKSPDERRLFEIVDKNTVYEDIIGWLDLDSLDAVVAGEQSGWTKYYTIKRVDMD